MSMSRQSLHNKISVLRNTEKPPDDNNGFNLTNQDGQTEMLLKP